MKIAAIAQVAQQEGMSALQILSGTGLSPSDLQLAETRTTLEQLMQVVRNVLQHLGEIGVGWRAGERLRVSAYGMYGYALLCSATLREAYDTCVRYHALATPVMDINWFEGDGEAVWRFPCIAALNAPGRLEVAAYRLLLEMQLAIHVGVSKDLMGPGCLPLRACMTLPEPAYAEALGQALGCPITYGAEVNQLAYAQHWLDRAPQLANPLTASQMSTACAKLLETLDWRAGVTRRVWDELTKVPGQFPDIETIAARLCISSRSLRRKLDAEGTSYQALLISVRLALAEDYLRQSLLSLDDVADALGFADSSSFRHAFKRWTGKTPTEYRGG